MSTDCKDTDFWNRRGTSTRLPGEWGRACQEAAQPPDCEMVIMMIIMICYSSFLIVPNAASSVRALWGRSGAVCDRSNTGTLRSSSIPGMHVYYPV
jgi:hypothetical protein